MDLMTDLEAGPSAAALTSGRATISDGRYYEVARQEEKGPWFLGQGTLTDRLFWAPIAESDDCRHLFVGARGKRLAFGCLTGARKGGVLFPSLRVIQSRDGGSSFVRQPTVLVGDEEGLSLTVLDDDSLVVAGACKPDSTGVCVPGAPVRLLPSAEAKLLRFTATESSEVPSLRGRVTQVVTSGGRLYATGLQASGRPAVLVSVDQGKTFRAVGLDLSGTNAAGDKDGEDLLQRMQPGKLVAGTEGRLSWVLHTDQGPVWVVLDEAGRVLSARLTPATHPVLAAAGTRAIAIGAEDGTVMESSNGGETFERLTRLPSFLWDKDAGPVAWCEKDGCVVGDAFSRSGWTDKNGGMVGWPEPVKPAVAPTPQRTPIVCKVVETVTGVIENTLDMPDAADAGRGAIGWSTVVVDRKTASVSVMHATTGSGHAVKPVVLLPPAPNPTRVALEARTQAEGAAALRYGFAAGPDGKPLVGSPVRIEVAWDNQFEGSPQRAQLTSTTPLRAADVTSLSGNVAAQANVGMLSVVPGGIHVCPHAVCDPASEPSFFLRNRGGVETVAPVPWPTQGLGGALPLSRHLMRVDGKNVPIAVHQQRSVVMRANLQQDGTYAYEALALAPSDARELGIQELSSWAYLSSTTMGLSRTLYHPDKGYAHAWVLRFDTDRGVGKTVEAPTQRDLSDPPVPCTEAQRTGSFRVLSPGMAGTEHPARRPVRQPVFGLRRRVRCKRRPRVRSSRADPGRGHGPIVAAFPRGFVAAVVGASLPVSTGREGRPTHQSGGRTDTREQGDRRELHRDFQQDRHVYGRPVHGGPAGQLPSDVQGQKRGHGVCATGRQRAGARDELFEAVVCDLTPSPGAACRDARRHLQGMTEHRSQRIELLVHGARTA
jgi:hypothetical protein